MGIFDFIKKFSAKKELPVVTRLKLSELQEWMDKKAENSFGDVDSELMDISKELKKEKENMTEKLQLLEDAKLSNPNPQRRLVSIMQGNRETYIRSARLLLKKTNLPNDSDKIIEFCEKYKSDLNVFSKQSIRSYHILHEFFENEVRIVSANVRVIKDLIENASETVKGDGNRKISIIKEAIEDIENSKIEIKDLKNKIKEQKNTLHDKEGKIKEKEGSTKGLKEGAEYKNLIKLIDSKKIVEQELDTVNRKMLHSFSIIESALKKYERITLNEKLIRSCIDAPLEALKTNERTVLADILSKMSNSIEKGDITLKDKKKEKTLHELKSMDKKLFDEFVENNKNLSKKIKKIDADISDNKILDEIETSKNQLNEERFAFENDKKAIEEMKEQLDVIDIKKMKEKLSKRIMNLFKEEVQID
jgi:hypothetical protein